MENKLRVYTLTFQFSRNYGAMAQAYALEKYLENNGCDVQIIDYWPLYAEKRFRWYGTFFEQPSAQSLFRLPVNWITAYVFNKFKKNYLSFTSQCKTIEDICRLQPADLIIVGSDQVWNPKLLGEYNDAYFLNFQTNSIKASFAASAGQDHFNPNELILFAERISKFDYISVRENSFCNILKEQGIANAQNHLDPVFLLSAQEYRCLTTRRKSEKYILIYYDDEQGLTEEAAVLLSKKNGNIPIYRIGKKRGKKEITNLQFKTVNEFISLIENAEYIVSRSFHATAFAVIFRKQFYAISAGNRSARLTSMLEQFDLMDRYILTNDDLKRIGSSDIDYSQHEKAIEKKITAAKSYLNTIMDSVKNGKNESGNTKEK